MNIPNFLQVYLPSYDLSKLDLKDSGVAREVITSILNEGDAKAVKWIFENYTLDEIRDCVEKPQKGVWFAESLNYWKQILEVNDISHYNDAILNINPL